MKRWLAVGTVLSLAGWFVPGGSVFGGLVAGFETTEGSRHGLWRGFLVGLLAVGLSATVGIVVLGPFGPIFLVSYASQLLTPGVSSWFVSLHVRIGGLIAAACAGGAAGATVRSFRPTGESDGS